MNTRAVALALFALASAVRAANVDEELSEVVVSVPEPRYVAPTTRDRIGRVWVPVEVDGKGPFRLVLDTGALRSAVTQDMATRLGLAEKLSAPVMLHGATGSAITPTIAVGTMQVGDLLLQPRDMPVVADVFGGAEGLLGTEGLQDHRIFIDFRGDYIAISRSKNRSAADGFSTVRFLPDPRHLLVVRVNVGGIPVRAIVDTGAQSTVGNLALQQELRKRNRRSPLEGANQVQGATGAWQSGVGVNLPRIEFGSLVISNAHATFMDLHIFDQWSMNKEPALLIGMDIIGLVDQLVIDYRRKELQIKPRT
ncbi:MAG: retroviral-like aspartic protease family protein [Pseudomonadota bacterium]